MSKASDKRAGRACDCPRSVRCCDRHARWHRWQTHTRACALWLATRACVRAMISREMPPMRATPKCSGGAGGFGGGGAGAGAGGGGVMCHTVRNVQRIWYSAPRSPHECRVASRGSSRGRAHQTDTPHMRYTGSSAGVTLAPAIR